VVDVHASQTQLNGTTRISSLDEVVASNEECGGEIFTFNDVLSNDQEDPGTKAARKMDWESLLASLSLRDRAIIQFMIEGKSGSAMARKLKVCPSTISNRKRDLAVKIQDFMGYKILVDIQRQPKWRNDLAANRERLACRHERNH
jgi:DNA-binding NarL/FixJ family response regulator